MAGCERDGYYQQQFDTERVVIDHITAVRWSRRSTTAVGTARAAHDCMLSGKVCSD